MNTNIKVNNTNSMDPILGAGIIAGAGSLLGGLFGSKSQSAANKANLKIARETNALNEKLFNQQMQYNWDMFHAQNAYNDPSAQAERLSAAGLNPYLDGVETNMASGSSAPSAPQMIAPTMQSSAGIIQNTASDISNIIFNSAVQQQKLANETKSVDIQYNKSLAEIAKMVADTKNINLKSDYQSILNFIADNTKEHQIKAAELSNQMTTATMDKVKAEADAVNLQNIASQMHLDFLPKQLALDLAQRVEQIKYTSAQRNLSYSQAKLNAKLAIESEARTNGININNYTAYKMADSLINQADYETQIKKKEKYNMDKYGNRNAPYEQFNIIGGGIHAGEMIHDMWNNLKSKYGW